MVNLGVDVRAPESLDPENICAPELFLHYHHNLRSIFVGNLIAKNSDFDIVGRRNARIGPVWRSTNLKVGN
jgi:hypothetical protein